MPASPSRSTPGWPPSWPPSTSSWSPSRRAFWPAASDRRSGSASTMPAWARAARASSASVCPTATSPMARPSCSTGRSGSPASGSRSGSRPRWPSAAQSRAERDFALKPGARPYGRRPELPITRAMSAAAQAAAEDHADNGASAFLSRQPVLDGQRRVTGYRISYATGPGEGSPAGGPGVRAATRLFGDILTVVGLEELVGSALAHLPVTPGLLLTLGVPPMRPDQVVLRVAHEYAVDPELRPVLDSLASRGYALSLYDLPGAQFAPELLTTFGIVELDFSAWSEPELRVAIAAISAARATAMAVELASEEEFAHAQALGFDHFVGPFYSSPRTTAVRDVPVAG